MGLASSRSYQPPKNPYHLGGSVRTIYLDHTYGAEPYSKPFYFNQDDPESLARELKRFNFAGIIVCHRDSPEVPKAYLVDDDGFETSIVGNTVTGLYEAIYPESYKGLVKFYVGCEGLEEFQRPLKHTTFKSLEASTLDLAMNQSISTQYYQRSKPRHRITSSSRDGN